MIDNMMVSTHSRPKAAGRLKSFRCLLISVSTHSRPKAAGFGMYLSRLIKTVSTHSRPKAAGPPPPAEPPPPAFQHTAARRRLGNLTATSHGRQSFNTQPPEGGWLVPVLYAKNPEIVSTHSRPKAAGSPVVIFFSFAKFQHTAARRRLGARAKIYKFARCFNTQPPEGGWHVSDFQSH